MLSQVDFLSARAEGSGRYPSSLASLSIRSLVSGFTLELLLNARLTVLLETPARLANSIMEIDMLDPLRERVQKTVQFLSKSYSREPSS